MKRIIRLSKVVTLNHAVTDPKEKSVYDDLVAEMQNQIHGQNTAGAVWKLHKTQNSGLFQMLTREVNNYALGLFRVNKGFHVSIIGRQGIEVPLELYFVSIEDYNFGNQAILSFHFKTNEFWLAEKISYALVLKGNNEASQTFVIDFDDKSISIIEHTEK